MHPNRIILAIAEANKASADANVRFEAGRMTVEDLVAKLADLHSGLSMTLGIPLESIRMDDNGVFSLVRDVDVTVHDPASVVIAANVKDANPKDPKSEPACKSFKVGIPGARLHTAWLPLGKGFRQAVEDMRAVVAFADSFPDEELPHLLHAAMAETRNRATYDEIEKALQAHYPGSVSGAPAFTPPATPRALPASVLASLRK